MVTVPVYVLLLFAGWTLGMLVLSVGLYRWKMILTGRAGPGSFPADRPEGSDFYRRAMRAHANCVENLPVYGAIVLVMVATGIQSPLLDKLAMVFILARIVQTLIHLSFVQTHTVVSFRSLFFSVQVFCMFWMGIYLLLQF